MDEQNLNPITNKNNNTIITLNDSYQYKNHSITLYDVQCVLQLLIRFHCRLSHVAAHTAIHTIQFTKNEKDLFSKDDHPSSSNNNFLRELYSFLKYHPPHPTFHSTESTIDDPVIAILTNDLKDRFLKMKQNPYKYNQFLSYLQKQQEQQHKQQTGRTTTIQDILQSLDEVIQHELQISHNLTKWPCEPFWSVGDDTHWKKEKKQQPQTITTAVATTTKSLLSPLITQLTSLLTPDCYKDPYVKCFVPRDLCEAKEMGGKNDTTCQSTTK